jgi:hypothetical protein
VICDLLTAAIYEKAESIYVSVFISTALCFVGVILTFIIFMIDRYNDR